ncbi:predicted protein [Sclerotinia sclerotiorum 1980 UF-70]|uniref:ribonuclease H n=2 Tax=Sclerotinia sclerotiorum (strain ATCC 18683 / 1980 / Ss-1) TaxID=665079 RepID=A7F7W9_SCLS1|nr:predicted protein [Sclerotinia sclerotiorum 1980 UF-70]APA14966.1 hypothetical protein sscle_14g097360 [Sclerotinia sclerotiorum 1980 UF-70]EDN98840.1 predicted protein [Sclerotinia sclerotiorum 1980 UF-70]
MNDKGSLQELSGSSGLPITDKDTTYIYTDASSTEKGIGIGVGIVAIQSNNRILYQERSNIGTNQLVYNGELFGVTRAIEYASSIAYTGQKFKIYSDNQAGLYRLKTPSDHPGQANQIRAIKAAEVIRAKGAEISLNWVPGHTSVEGNELADKLAKEATTIQPTSNETSFGLLGMTVKEYASDQWLDTLKQYELRSNQSPSTYSKLFSWKIGSKIKLPSGTTRNTASAFFQLKLGHGYIKSYLHRFKLTNNKCICSNIEAPQHLLISCPIYKTKRKEIFKKIPLSKNTIQFLLHTKIGIELAIKFINITKIATRAWHLARTLEQEVIEEGVVVEEERGEENEEEAVEEIREGFDLLTIS